jgi:hypothetical protein
MSIFRKCVVTVGVFASFYITIPNTTHAQCPGNCDGDATVEINELITCVRISLGSDPPTCALCNPDGDDAVEINELILAVNFSLGIRVDVDGRCIKPGPSGLEGCRPGTAVSVYRCDDRERCLTESAARTELVVHPPAMVTNDGSLQMNVADCRIFDNTLIFIAQIEPAIAAEYRIIDLGPAAAGSAGGRLDVGTTPGAAISITISPNSEAAVRLLEQFGLANFSDERVQAVSVAVENANADTDFAGLDANMAAERATETAQNDPRVREILPCETGSGGAACGGLACPTGMVCEAADPDIGGCFCADR